MRTIEYKVSYENMISRIPGLFAYLDSNELGEVSLHHAYDSNCGCYGKIVENIKLPEGKGLTVDKKLLLKEGETYTFRTIITYYYQYRDLFTEYVYNSDKTRSITPEEYKNLDVRKQRFYKRQINSDFIKFVERGIGKIETPSDTYKKCVKNSGLYVNICKDSNVITKEEYSKLSLNEKKNYRLKRNENVPKFIYLANVISLYNELVKMGKQCKFYQKNKENFGNDKHMCCLCERYINMGGDDLRDYVESLIEKYKEISNEYFDYADNEKSMTLDFDIDLVSSYDDMGIMDSYVEEWLPYKQYYKGDRVFYDGSIWRCTVDNTGYFDEDEMKVVFSDKYFKKINNVFEKIDIEYENIEDRKIKITSEKYQELYNALENDDEKSEFKSKYKLYSPQSLKDISKNTFKITGQTDSKLKDLRRFVTYMNDDNIGEKPQNGYDWLFYYRIGNICNISTLNDDLGNILKLDGKPTASKDDGDELMAYGDVITNITANKIEEWTANQEYYKDDRVFYKGNVWHYQNDNTGYFYEDAVGGIWRCIEDNTGQVVFSDKYFEKVEEIEEWTEENTITFEYIINAHLIGNSDSYSYKLDEDKNVIHYWKDFTYEENTGVKYTETYNYAKDSDLDKLINREFKLDIGKTDKGKAAILIYLGNEKIEIEIEEWTADKQYYKGDRVSHDNSIWRCKVDNKAAEFNANNFEEIKKEVFTFKNYVNGKYDDNLKSFKFEFITFNNELSYNKTIANQEVNIISTITDFEVFKNDNDEFMEVHSMNEENLNDKGISMYRHDYFNGITYAPTKKIDVYIERGSTSCFQQHIAFSEIKTINDMTEYRNGSFFKINEG